MKKLNLKDGAIFPSLNDIIDSYKNSFEKHSILTANRIQINSAIEEFDKWGSEVQKQTIQPSRGTVRSSIISCYKNPPVDARKILRSVSRLTNKDESDTCVYCGINENPDLDHYLPKSVFPHLSIYPKNLIPICPICNRKKGKRYHDSGKKLFLYPLTDHFVEKKFLAAKVKINRRSSNVSFEILPVAGISEQEQEILQSHFNNLNLKNRYIRKATSYISRLRKLIKDNNMTDEQKKEKVERTLSTSKEDDHVNHWKIATLEALLSQINLL